MQERGVHTLAEILSQPAIWSSTLDAFAAQDAPLRALLARGGFEQVIFTGCGSTHYLSLTAAALFQALTGILAQARPASEIALHPDLALAGGRRALLVAVSRSGATTETVEAVRVFRQRQPDAPVIAIVCDSASLLAGQADVLLASDAAQEVSVAQTRSFSSMLLLAQAFAATAAGVDTQPLHQLPRLCEQIIAAHHPAAAAYGGDRRYERFFFLGSGLLYGVACEAMLKLKEMSLSYSEAYHTLEFRHGPMSMVDARALVIGLISDHAAAHELNVLDDMQAHGAHCLALVGDAPMADPTAQTVLNLRAAVPAWARPVLYLPALQLLAYHRAIVNNTNPDRPENLDAVVSLKPF
jgi:glucosamine--fructose-6-phosphate aminotransferase (isomerizing)